ncbi:MAG: M23 family metallopeptidase [Hyphomonadaceae bacterium]
MLSEQQNSETSAVPVVSGGAEPGVIGAPEAPPLGRRLRFGLPVALGALAAALAIGGFWAASAGLFGGLSPAEAARLAAEKDAREHAAVHAAFTEVYLGHETQEVMVARGETLARILTRAGASAGEASAAMSAASRVFDPRSIRPGQPINVYFQREGERVELTGLAFRAEPGATVTVNRISNGGFAARQVMVPGTWEQTRILASVQNSLYATALAQGATDGIIAQMADVFAYDVDFQRDVRPGDPFELVFYRYFAENGETVRTGELSYVALTTHGRLREFYRFQSPSDREPEWYDPDGKSARRFLMKTPINGARLSSGFGMRRHPIQGFNRMHRGTDFAAATGTPIMAAGDGVIQRAGRFGGYGNYIRIRHSSQYDTAYGHMSRFARGVRPGVRVRQGQVIGYVGSTGQSTGPHLHYEVFQNGRQINPMNLRVATGRNLEGLELQLFQAERARIDRLREMRNEEAAANTPITRTAQNDGGGAAGGLRR